MTDVVDGVLEIGVVPLADPPLVPCDAMGYARTLDLTLEEPFTGTIWHDRFGYRHFLASPLGLVNLAGLPEGWELRAERDVEQSRTGRWERTYGPDPDLTDETATLVLFQSFDGPVNVTGGTDQPTGVLVNGRTGYLYRWPPTGELVLVWQLGTDGIALVGYEQTFTVEELIALAESVTAPDP